MSMTKKFYATQIILQISSKMKEWENRFELENCVKRMCRKHKKDILKSWFKNQLAKQTLFIGGKLLKPHTN